MKSRTCALLVLLGLVVLSIVKGWLGIDDASTVLIATVGGAVIGYYFGTAKASPPPSE